MARRRYQDGCVYRRGDVWIGRWREDEVDAEGHVQRRLKYEAWKVAEYPTKRLVQRELKRKLAEVNARNYRAKPQTSFEVFAKKWETSVLPNLKPSTQSAIKSQLRKHLVPAFGSIALSNLTGEPLQRFVSESKLSPKTVKNLVATLRILWNTAKAWNLVEHDPFQGLRLPERVKPEVRFFTADEMRRIIEAADEPYKTFFWLAAETGMRAGELCALRWEDVNLDRGIVQVRRSAWRGKVGSPKTVAGTRTFAISVRLAECLAGRKAAGGLLFHASTGNPWDANLLVKRKLRPILRTLGLQLGGMHAFRHGNATVMDRVEVPTRVRQARLGHADLETTMGYTHVISEDDKRAAAEVARVIFEKPETAPRITWHVAAGNA